jgi:hypothetical protein
MEALRNAQTSAWTRSSAAAALGSSWARAASAATVATARVHGRYPVATPSADRAERATSAPSPSGWVASDSALRSSSTRRAKAGGKWVRPWNAAEEVAAAVVSWSSRAHGEPDARVALALVEGYRRAGGVLPGHSPTVLAGSLSAVANWLELNLRRSLSQATDQAVRWQAEAEVAGALVGLPRRLARLDRWTELLG